MADYHSRAIGYCCPCRTILPFNTVIFGHIHYRHISFTKGFRNDAIYAHIW